MYSKCFPSLIGSKPASVEKKMEKVYDIKILAILRFRVRLGRCCVELYYGTVLSMLSLLLLTVMRLHKRLGALTICKEISVKNF